MDDTADADVTADVGSEGGSPGDVEVAHDSVPAAGSEAGETWQPSSEQSSVVSHLTEHC